MTITTPTPTMIPHGVSDIGGPSISSYVLSISPPLERAARWPVALEVASLDVGTLGVATAETGGGADCAAKGAVVVPAFAPVVPGPP